MVNEVRLGIIGISDGNGHPYSFSAIINGYNQEYMKKSGWDRIYNYLETRHESDFLINIARVTHIWTQDHDESKRIALATQIECVCHAIEDMIEHVDGVIIARDDFETHYKYAKLFLDAGLCVFVDKPLSILENELQFFKEYMLRGQLMSCSGFRYARELDPIRSVVHLEEKSKTLKLIRGSVVGTWEKYGVHMLDAIFGMVDFNVRSVCAVRSNIMHVIINNGDYNIEVDALYSTAPTFDVSVWGQSFKEHVSIHDNFIAFRRTLYMFIKMIKTRISSIDPELTLGIMKILIAANLSAKEHREVLLHEIRV